MHFKNIYASHVKVCKAISLSVKHNNCKCKTHTQIQNTFIQFLYTSIHNLACLRKVNIFFVNSYF